MSVSEPDELARVMREIVELMQADGAVLTMHPEGMPPQAIHVDPMPGVSGDVIETMLVTADPGHSNGPADQHRWSSIVIGETRWETMALPVRRIEGHSQLIISVFFATLTEDGRRHAEQIYLSRRPFAVGYFRLWQLERTRMRHVAALEAALGLFGMGVMLLDRSGRLSFANAAATAILDRRDGLRRHGTRIAGTELKSSLRLQVAIDHVISDSHAGAAARRAPLLRLERASAEPLIVSIFPPTEVAIEPSDVAAILYLIDPAVNVDELIEPICRLYRLSPLETKLVRFLASGATLNEAAAGMRVKDHTARSCLKQVFAKTGTNRQVDLIRVMLSSLVHTTGTTQVELF